MIFLRTRQDTNNFQIIRYDENSLFASIWGLGGGGLLIRDIFSSFFYNEWRHDDITAIVKDSFVLTNFMILSDTLLFRNFSPHGNIKGNDQWTLPLASAI